MKILIISYYAFPLNAVPSYRIESFCEGFTKQGADVTLLTRHWNKTFTSWEDVLKSDKRPSEIKNENGYRQIFLPYKAKPKESRFRLISMLSVLCSYLKGDLQPETNSFKNFKDYTLDLLQKEGDFDLILVSAQPLSLVKLANYLNKKTKVPYVVDMRDYLNNKYLSNTNNLTLREKVLNTLTAFHIERWLRNSILVSTVTPVLKSVFQKEYNKETILVLNGVEQKYFQNKNIVRKPNKIFTVRYLGSAYEGFDFKPVIEGLSKFLNENSNVKINIELIGMHNSKIEREFEDTFTPDILRIIKKRIPKEEIVEKSINSDVLILVWNLYKGNYGTKVFDYLSSGSHILLSPSDNSIVEELIQNHENGSIANTPDEVFKVLEEQYSLWKKGWNKTEINRYPQFARENIAVEMYKKLNKVLNK